MSDAAQARVRAYHEASKHHLPEAFAPSPGQLDWANQPAPFRRYVGAPRRALPLRPLSEAGPPLEQALEGRVEPAPWGLASLGQLLQDSLGLTAWKQAGTSRWALRANPSSGNLHPSEAYLLADLGVRPRSPNSESNLGVRTRGPASESELGDGPALWHYAPVAHALERRAELSPAAWSALVAGLPEPCALLGLSSIGWREAWKYGLRSFRYCQHDAGHALACVALAAAGLGWSARLVLDLDDPQLSSLLGLESTGPEAERPEWLLALSPAPLPARPRLDPGPALAELARPDAWRGRANELSEEHRAWPGLDEVWAASERSGPPPPEAWQDPARDPPPLTPGAPALRRLIHQRRSVVALDGRTGLTRDGFYDLLRLLLPGPGRAPGACQPWAPRVDLALFVHRVEDLAPGIYVLQRSGDLTLRQALLDPGQPPPGCPSELPLFLIAEGDVQGSAQALSCWQTIASDGVFAAALLAPLTSSLRALGPWAYRWLHWEAGALGQLLYLGAEAFGLGGTGIGCFFDDGTHELLGLDPAGDRQVLYHFALGGRVPDHRVELTPPYSHLSE
ncbi:MAG TPA: hypothetical protein DEA08_07185 [Planctomycetes bacterium]|nr:hypothetical protein [Planctomycetota bacterium]